MLKVTEIRSAVLVFNLHGNVRLIYSNIDYCINYMTIRNTQKNSSITFINFVFCFINLPTFDGLTT